MYSEQAREILQKLTIKEKLDLTTGVDYWHTLEVKEKGLNNIVFADGPHGVRKENEDDEAVALKASYPATAFPPAVCMASTWNLKLIKKLGEELAKQTKDQGIDIILGPGTNIKRDALCGRNFEYFSEDPYLAGKLARSYIEGLQSMHAGACVKHFAANNQERLRQSISAVIDERTFREIYLPAFEEAIKAQPYSIMCSYNRINGVYSSDNALLLDEILRKEWGFKGFVVTDWNAMNDKVAAIKAKCDVEMPSTGIVSTNTLKKALRKKKITIEEIDDVVINIIEWALKIADDRNHIVECSYDKAHEVAREVAEEGFVLLKNDEKILPFNEDKEIVVIGEMAKNIRYQGAGSSQINPIKVVNFIDALDNKKCKYEYYPVYKENEEELNEEELAKALNAASSKKQVVLFVGLPASFEAEAMDRKDMKLPTSHNKLVEAVIEKCPNATVVLLGGSAVELPWAEKVKSLLNASLGGEAVGEALYNIIYGKKSPSGKLTETYPISYEDNIVHKYFPMGPRTVEYREGLFVGYRYYDAAEKEVRFPFGHGLTYTTFDYSDLKIDGLKISFKIKNKGEVDAYEIPQVYVRAIDSKILKCKKDLKGFDKVFVKAGESVDVHIELDDRAFAYYSKTEGKFISLNGKYEIQIGKSSRDIVLKKEIELNTYSEPVKSDILDSGSVYYNLKNAKEIPDKDFIELYGSELPKNTKYKRGEFTMSSTLGDLSKTLFGKIILLVAPKVIEKAIPNADFTTKLVLRQGLWEQPLRALNGTSAGLLHENVAKGLCLWGNRVRIIGFTLIFVGLIQSGFRILNAKIKKAKEKRKQKKDDISK